jgi:uncharacterized RDD family membrane protein YckC
MTAPAPRYAGFWIRVAATLIDSVLLLIITLPLLLWIYGVDYLSGAPGAPLLRGVADFLISCVFPIAAVLAFWHWRAATPGKILLELRIVDAATLGRPSFKQFLGRYFAYLIATLPLGLGLLWVAVDARKQGWHDKLAGTLVLRVHDDTDLVA